MDPMSCSLVRMMLATASCSKLPGGDAFAVTSAIGADERVGSKYLLPGSAFGGPCFPRDNRAFAWFANSVGETAALAKATDEVNWSQIDYIVEMQQSSQINHLNENTQTRN